MSFYAGTSNPAMAYDPYGAQSSAPNYYGAPTAQAGYGYVPPPAAGFPGGDAGPAGAAALPVPYAGQSQVMMMPATGMPATGMAGYMPSYGGSYGYPSWGYSGFPFGYSGYRRRRRRACCLDSPRRHRYHRRQGSDQGSTQDSGKG